jgi:capsular polysaccharide biosynthesis protein
MPESQKNLSLLIQTRDSNRRVYEELLMRQSQSDVSKQMEIGEKTTNFKIVDAAFLPKVPVSPNILMLILMSIAVGLGAGSGVVILMEKYRDTLVDIDQLEDLDVTVLATIPTIDTPVHLQKIRQKDKIVFVFSSIYFAGILGVLLLEAISRFF